ncbi:iron-sulfur cluster insertion protein ErpA [Acidiferrobacter sp. SPIII_3]|jgi:iron-sulfur cluster insertion protein|uniref:iron-sulfur cluster insertion protein ErpA n=1 Tax=Acidiferrobacter sp. SPIII_3 TaxID=1281578 RepID=UPI000D72EF2E|nr:iron-sulfur cluster insertion protein ErpA [Acidiferrobacter sp. SPIII_3]
MTRTALKEIAAPIEATGAVGGIEDPITVSASALEKMRALMGEEGQSPLYLRIWVGGGGCAGFQYGFCFEGATEPGDRVIEKDGVQVVIDPLSLPYLTGVEIDYRDDLKGARFIVKNPNARTTCGCGNSFSA